MVHQPEPDFRGASEVRHPVHRQTQVKAAPAHEIFLRDLAEVGVRQVETKSRSSPLQAADFELRQIRATRRVRLHESSRDIAPRGDAKHGLVGENEYGILWTTMLAQEAGSRLKHTGEFRSEADAIEFP